MRTINYSQCGAAIVVAASFVMGAAAQTPTDIARKRVHPSASVTTAGSPVAFVDALKEGGITAGLYMSEDTWKALRFVRDEPARPADTSMTVGQAVQAFRVNHPGWSVALTRTGVIIREDDISRRTDSITRFSVTNVSVRDAFVAAQRAVNQSIPLVGGRVGSILSTPGDTRPLPTNDLLPVSLTLYDVTFEALLESIAEQAPGTAWALVRHTGNGKPYDTLLLRFPNGTESEAHWPLYVRK